MPLNSFLSIVLNLANLFHRMISSRGLSKQRMLSTINVTFNKKLSDASSDELRYFARQLSLFIQFILLVNKIPNKISPSKSGFTEFGCTNSEFNA